MLTTVGFQAAVRNSVGYCNSGAPFARRRGGPPAAPTHGILVPVKLPQYPGSKRYGTASR